MNDEIQASAALIANTERELANAQRALRDHPTLDTASAVAAFETSLHQQRTAHDRLVATIASRQKERETDALERELAECEEALAPSVVEARMRPLAEREVAARLEVFGVALSLRELEGDLVDTARRAARLERELGRERPDPGRQVANLQMDLRRARKNFVNERLTRAVEIDHAAKRGAVDPRRDALEGVLIP